MWEPALPSAPTVGEKAFPELLGKRAEERGWGKCSELNNREARKEKQESSVKPKEGNKRGTGLRCTHWI